MRLARALLIAVGLTLLAPVLASKALVVSALADDGGSGDGGGGVSGSGGGDSGGGSGDGGGGGDGDGGGDSGRSGSGHGGDDSGGNDSSGNDDSGKADSDDDHGARAAERGEGGRHRGRGGDDRDDDDFRGGGRTEAREASTAVARGLALPLAQILPTVGRAVEGDVLEVDLRHTLLGGWRYEILVLTRAGDYREVIVDARRNEVLRIGAR